MKQKTKTTRKAAGKKRVNVKKRSFLAPLVPYILLFCLLVCSLAATGYVVFFRNTLSLGDLWSGVGLAKEAMAADDSVGGQKAIPFEEPDPPGDHSLGPDDPVVTAQVPLPLVAIIIDDMGYHEEVGRKLLALPLNLTFSFLPFAPFTKEQEETAYQSGRMVLLHLPLQPKSAEWDPGPGALYLQDDIETQRSVLEKNLLEVPHAVGLNNHMGSLYTGNEEAMKRLLEIVQEKELFFVDSFTTSDSKGLLLARKLGIPTARRNVFLDNVQSQDLICKQLQELVRVAEKRGQAIGIGHPNEATLKALISCQDELLTRVKLVDVRQLLLPAE